MTANGNSNEADANEEEFENNRKTKKVDEDEFSKLANQYVDIADKKEEAWVDTTEFNLAIGAAILVNALMIGVETEMCRDPEKCNQNNLVGWFWFANEQIFCTLWVFEMLARMHTHARYSARLCDRLRYSAILRYFCDGWNILDFFLVGVAILDAWVPHILGLFGMDTNIDIKMMSVLRIVRLMRLVRLLRLLRIFKELWLLVNGFIEALRVLTWIFVLLGMIIYCSAILTTLSIGDSCEEEFPHFASCDEMFGGVFKSMYTLFQVLTLESWSMAVVRPVMKTFPIAVPFFIAFLFLTSFGLMNIVVGVIVENTLQAAAQNEEKINKRRANEAQKNLEALREIFEEADEDGSGTVDKEEFRNIIKKPEVEAQFRQLELPTSEAEELFDILDEDKTGELDIKTFVEGAFKLKGAAKAKDLMGVVVSTRSVARRVDKIEERLADVYPLVKTLPDIIEKSVKEALAARSPARGAGPNGSGPGPKGPPGGAKAKPAPKAPDTLPAKPLIPGQVGEEESPKAKPNGAAKRRTSGSRKPKDVAQY